MASVLIHSQFIGINRRSKNPDVEPFVQDDRGNRVRLPFEQAVLLTRSQAQRIQSRFGNVVQVMTLENWRNQTQKKTKLLILRTQGIGDLILLTPVLRKLAKEYDEIHLGVRHDHRCVVDTLPYVTKVYDHDIDGKGNVPKADPTFVSMTDLNYWAESKDSLRASSHRSDSFARGMKIELAPHEKEPDLYLSEEAVKRGKVLLKRKKGKKYCAVQLCGSHNYRNFWGEHDKCPHGQKVGTCATCKAGNLQPFPKHAELITAIADAGFIPVLLCHYVKLQQFDGRSIDLQGKCSLAETFGVINRCDVLVGADSGLVHVSLALGVPTVGMFGICSGRFRTPTYPTTHTVMERMPCVGCGDYAMSHCKQPNGIDGECMNFPVEQVVNAIKDLPKRTIKAKVASDKPSAPTVSIAAPSVIIPGKSGSNGVGLWMTMMFQDETKEHMERFVARVISNPAIEHVIAVDGGCPTGADKVLSSIGKVEVHRIPYSRNYWNAQAHQRNACFSFIKDYRPVFYMDPDEGFSEHMAGWLKEFPHLGIEYGLIARATWDTAAEAKAQNYLKPGTHQWPDWQPRFYRWRSNYKFHGAAHHITLGCPEPTLIDDRFYVLHYEGESGKREERQAQWGAAMKQKIARVG